MGRIVLLLVGLISAGGCSTAIKPPRLGDLYNQAAQMSERDRHPVIVIPGILGSKLKQSGTGRVVWGAFGGGAVDPRTAEGARLFTLPMAAGHSLHELRDDVVPDGVLDRVRLNLIGLPIELNAYAQVLATLGAGGFRDELLGNAGAVDYGGGHFTCFQFAYDWRRDIAESAAELHRFILEKRHYVCERLREEYGSEFPDLRFDLVAHSMGGLVARYYLMYGAAQLPADGSLPPVTWEGAKYVHRVVLVGTPNAGSIKALFQLVEGASLSPILPTYPPEMVGTFPSVYELLPRTRHRVLVDGQFTGNPEIDLFDPIRWEEFEWGLAARDRDSALRRLLPDVADANSRRQIALDHLRKCLQRAKQFHSAMDVEDKPPSSLEFHLFAGDAILTAEAASMNRTTRRLRVARFGAGDGTVLRTSALLDERAGGDWRPGVRTPIAWRNVTFLFREHLGITQDSVFHDNLLYLLLEDRGR